MEKGDNAEDHFNKLMDLFQRLDALGGRADEEWKIGMVLASLPQNYSTLVTTLEARNQEDLTWSMVHSKILDECLRQQQNYEIENPTEKVMKIQTNDKGNVRFEKKRCYFCKKENHNIDECLKLKRYKEFSEFYNFFEQDKKEKEKVNEKVNNIQDSDEDDEYVLSLYHITKGNIKSKQTLVMSNPSHHQFQSTSKFSI